MKKINVYITGATGLVLSDFVEKYNDRYKIFNMGIDTNPNIENIYLDLLDKDSIEKACNQIKEGVFIHAAAYTDVSKAETERNNKDGICYRLNCKGTNDLYIFPRKSIH